MTSEKPVEPGTALFFGTTRQAPIVVHNRQLPSEPGVEIFFERGLEALSIRLVTQCGGVQFLIGASPCSVLPLEYLVKTQTLDLET